MYCEFWILNRNWFWPLSFFFILWTRRAVLFLCWDELTADIFYCYASNSFEEWEASKNFYCDYWELIRRRCGWWEEFNLSWVSIWDSILFTGWDVNLLLNLCSLVKGLAGTSQPSSISRSHEAKAWISLSAGTIVLYLFSLTRSFIFSLVFCTIFAISESVKVSIDLFSLLFCRILCSFC